jgi:hypothetical protein
MTPTLLSTTTCAICAQKFEAETIPIIGEDPAAKTQRLMAKLMQHLQATHMQTLLEIVAASQHYTTLLVLQQFQLTDAPLIEARETARKFAVQVLRKGMPD